MSVTALSVMLFMALRLDMLTDSPQDTFNRKQVSEYIELLKSSDEVKRQEGKEKLLLLGSSSIGLLVSLLGELSADPFRPWFVSGREREGIEAWERRQKADDSGNVAEARAASELIAQLEISGRLKNDVMELLGQLRAEEAVPILIRLMEERPVDNLWEKMRYDMKALVAIGSAAVPQLIESIKNAKDTAKRNWQPIPAYRIQVRAAIVLGMIGDERALPVLEELLRQENDMLVDLAIKQIKEKSGKK